VRSRIFGTFEARIWPVVLVVLADGCIWRVGRGSTLHCFRLATELAVRPLYTERA
jgi:hypothetical protein